MPLVESPLMPTFVVLADNWSCEVNLSPFDAQFKVEMQMLEAATAAIEALRGLRKDIKIEMAEGHEGKEPILDYSLYIFDANKDPDKGSLIFTPEALADAGFYKESIEMMSKFAAEMEEDEKKEAKRCQKQDKSLKNFDKLKKNPPKKRNKS